MIYLELFFCFFKIGLFSFGGGYAALPLIQEQVVQLHNWLSIGEFTDLITISQMTPGPIAINGATFVGTQIAGLPGALAATTGCVLPSFVIVLLLAFLYKKYGNVSIIQGALAGLRPVVVALIATAGITVLQLAFWGEQGISTGIKGLQVEGVLLFAAALFVLRKWKANPVLIMAVCGVAGVVIYR